MALQMVEANALSSWFYLRKVHNFNFGLVQPSFGRFLLAQGASIKLC